MTQGFYGNEGGLYCDDNTTSALLTSLLSQGTLQVGNNSPAIILYDPGDAACIITQLPGGGPEAAITGTVPGGFPNSCADMSGVQMDPIYGNIENTLVAQALTLSLNLRLPDNQLALFTFDLDEYCFMTVEALTCNDPFAMPDPAGTIQYFTVPEAVVQYLSAALGGAAPSVADLLNLANDAISGSYVPVNAGNPTLSDITAALGAINDGFDECRVFMGWIDCAAVPAGKSIADEANMDLSYRDPQLYIYPNPSDFSAQLVIEVYADAEVRLEIFSLDGRRLAILVDQHMMSGDRLTTTFHSGQYAPGTYLYRFSTESGHVQYGKISVIR